MTRWPTDGVGAQSDWLEFTLPAAPDQTDDAGDPDYSPRLYRVNVSFMLSGYRCIFGQGCPGILISGAMFDRGCCQIGVTVDLDEVDKLDALVGQLTEEDLDKDLLKQVKGTGWRYEEHETEQDEDAPTRNQRRKRRKVLTNHHTRVVDGACILANRASGSLAAPGCSLHRLAIRTGVHHSETKPEICWSIPFSVSEEYDEDRQMLVVRVTATEGHIWGHYDTDSSAHPGWWCTESPEAYTGAEPVYKSNEVELRKLMGDTAYTHMTLRLDQLDRRAKMPAETHGRSIPLMVKERVELWRGEGGHQDELARSTEVLKNLNID